MLLCICDNQDCACFSKALVQAIKHERKYLNLSVCNALVNRFTRGLLATRAFMLKVSDIRMALLCSVTRYYTTVKCKY